MRTISIVGDNYLGKWEKARVACRGIILRDGMILLSCETANGIWMLPGGGLEPGEDERACCIREIAEETGILTEPSECALEIDEYYGDRKWVNRYFFGTVAGKTGRNLTDAEKAVRMEPGWLPLEEAVRIFPGTNPMRAWMK